MSRRDARRVVIVVRRPLRRNPYAQSAAVRVRAGSQPSSRRGEGAAAKQPYLRLLIGRQRERCLKVRHRSGDQAAVIAPAKGDVRSYLRELMKLILYLSCLLESLIVINAKDAFRQIGIEEESAALGREIARPRVPGGEEGRETFVVGQVDARRYAVDLRQMPRDREGDRRAQDHAEVVGVARALPEVVDVDDEVTPDALLNSEVELMPAAGFERFGDRIAQDADQSALAGRAREDQVLVVRRLKASSVRGAQDGVGLFEII